MKPSEERMKCLNKNSRPVAHKNLTLDNYDLDDWEPTETPGQYPARIGRW